jgi:hypothetical protein
MGVKLIENRSITEVCIKKGMDEIECRQFTGDKSYNFSELAYFAVRNMDMNEPLNGSVSVNVTSTKHLGESRGRSDGSRVMVFYGDPPSPDPEGITPSNAAMIVLASVCFLLVVLAAIAYLTITHLQRAAAAAGPAPVHVAEAQSTDFETVVEKPKEVEIDDGNPDMPPADL